MDPLPLAVEPPGAWNHPSCMEKAKHLEELVASWSGVTGDDGSAWY